MSDIETIHTLDRIIGRIDQKASIDEIREQIVRLKQRLCLFAKKRIQNATSTLEREKTQIDKALSDEMPTIKAAHLKGKNAVKPKTLNRNRDWQKGSAGLLYDPLKLTKL
jgi:hypothetical protein